MNKPKRTHVMDSVDILDRVTIHIFQPKPGHFTVDFTCKEQNKQLVFDEQALKTLQKTIAERARELKLTSNHENTRGFLEEFTGRLVKEYYKVNLVVIEDIPEGVEDHYKAFRNIN